LADQFLGPHGAFTSVDARYRPCAAMYDATVGSTSPEIDLLSATRSRTTEEEIWIVGIRRNTTLADFRSVATGCPPASNPASARRTSSAPPPSAAEPAPSRSATARLASPS